MSKATHNGTCQCCGRKQAVNVRTGRIAKHGYTVDYGFFDGTCGGSDHLPLEVATDLNIKTVEAMIKFAAEREAKADGEITKVPVVIREEDAYVWGKINKRTEWLTREQYEAKQSYYRFDDEVQALRFSLRRTAEIVRKDAADLDALRDKVHGQPLIARKVEQPIEREYFKSYREAYQRVQELKALGHTAQQRRQAWSRGGGFAVTYR